MGFSRPRLERRWWCGSTGFLHVWKRGKFLWSQVMPGPCLINSNIYIHSYIYNYIYILYSLVEYLTSSETDNSLQSGWPHASRTACWRRTIIFERKIMIRNSNGYVFIGDVYWFSHPPMGLLLQVLILSLETLLECGDAILGWLWTGRVTVSIDIWHITILGRCPLYW